jgi:hypothetical protein
VEVRLLASTVKLSFRVSSHLKKSLILFNGLRCEVVVHFVDFGETVKPSLFNLSFHVSVGIFFKKNFHLVMCT